MRQDHNIDHSGIISLRYDFPDLYADLHAMVLHAVSLWGKSLMDDHFDGDLDNMLSQFKAKTPPVPTDISNRLYITTEFFRPCLIAPNLSDATIRAISSNTNYSSALTKQLLSYGRDCITVWLFQRNRLTFARPLTPPMAAEMLSAFGRENIVSLAHIRPHWLLPR